MKSAILVGITLIGILLGSLLTSYSQVHAGSNDVMTKIEAILTSQEHEKSFLTHTERLAFHTRHAVIESLKITREVLDQTFDTLIEAI